MCGRLEAYVEENLGAEYVNQPAFDMEKTYAETSPSTPVSSLPHHLVHTPIDIPPSPPSLSP